MKKIIGTLILAALLFSCKSGKNISQKNNDMSVSAVEQTIIYKTIRDFSQLVPFIMNDDRTKLYPILPQPICFTTESLRFRFSLSMATCSTTEV